MTRDSGPSARRVAAATALVLLAGCGASQDSTTSPDESSEARSDGGSSASSQHTAVPPSDDGTAAPPDEASAPPSTGDGIPAVGEPDGLDQLTEQQRVALEGEGTVLAARQVDGGVVAAVASADGDTVGAQIVAEPRDLLDTTGSGGSGELLLPGDSCHFQSVDAGWTLVITTTPSAVVSLVLADGTRVQQLARPADVDGRTIGVVFVEGALDRTGPAPSADPGGTC